MPRIRNERVEQGRDIAIPEKQGFAPAVKRRRKEEQKIAGNLSLIRSKQGREPDAVGAEFASAIAGSEAESGSVKGWIPTIIGWWPEFVTLVAPELLPAKSPYTEEQLRHLFRMFDRDTNGDDMINFKEFAQTITSAAFHNSWPYLSLSR
ncbi:Putative calcium-binding protein CML17 [Glycine soja]|nr:Putative calcium-binding protein CML17 [Glycine soja]